MNVRKKRVIVSLLFLVAIAWMSQPIFSAPLPALSGWQGRTIPILGTALDHQSNQIGVVAHLVLGFRERNDQYGLNLRFRTKPGRFSPAAQVAVQNAIIHTARAAGLNEKSWSVQLMIPYNGITMYGESLSAMVGLAVVALAQGDTFPQDRVVTGKVLSDGHLGSVGGVPQKIEAAYAEHFQRVIVPEEHDTEDGDWRTPFLMHISPVANVTQAYQALTGQPLRHLKSSG